VKKIVDGYIGYLTFTVTFNAARVTRNAQQIQTYECNSTAYRVDKYVDSVRASAVLNLAVVKAHVVRPHHVTNQQIAVGQHLPSRHIMAFNTHTHTSNHRFMVTTLTKGQRR